MPQKNGDKNQASGKRRGLKFWLLTAAAASVILGILISALLPLGIQWGMKKALVEFGAESVEVENIDFNAFTGRIVVYGLEFNGPEEGSLSLDRLIVDLDLVPAWKKRIKARHVSVIGLTLDVVQPENGDFAIGGFPVALPEGEDKSPDSDQGADNPWGLGIEMLDLNDIHVRFSALGVKEDITLDRAQLSDFHSWDQEKTGQIDVGFMFNGGLIQIMGEADLFGETPIVTAELKVGEMPMGWLIPYLTSEEVRREVGKRPLHRLFPALENYDLRTIEGELWLRSKLDIQLDRSTGGRTASLKSSLNVKNLDVTGSLASIPIRYRESQFIIDSALEYGDEGSINLDNIRVTAASSMEEMRLDSIETGRNILSVDLYRLMGLVETGTDLAEAERVYFEGVKILEGDSGSHAINMKRVEFSDIRFSDLSRLEVAEIAVIGLDNLVALDSNGSINLVRELEELVPESSGSGEGRREKTTAGKLPMTVKVDRISVSQDSGIRIHDESVKPSVEMTLTPLEIEIASLDSAQPNNPSSLVMTSKFGKYSDLDIRGTVKPFASKPTMDLKVTVSSFDLPPLTPYSKKNIGHLIKSGHLDADIHWRIDQGIIDSQVNLLLHKFRLEAVDEKDEEAFSEKLDIPIPVNMGLSLLQDKDDNIDLKLPIKGNMESPEFQLRSVIYKAVGKAMTAGAVGYFAPLGLQIVLNVALPPGTITLAGVLAGEATKLRFDPLQFAPLEYQLTGEHGEYLDKLAQLIQDRPGVELVFCGISTSRDLEALKKSAGESAESGPGAAAAQDQDLPAAEPEASEGQAIDADEPGEMSITDEERSVLQGIAKKRALAVKDYLVEHGVEPGRLLICFSEFEEKQDAVPRVEVAL